jgi:CBS domain-containing protein
MENLRQETVRDNMSHPARTVAPEMTLGDLLRLFGSNDFAAYPVTREDQLVGIVSRADSIRPFAVTAWTDTCNFDAIMGTTVGEIMSSLVIAVAPDATLEQVIQLMEVHDLESLPVVEGENRVSGIVARQDIIRALARRASDSSLPLDLRPMGYAIA